MGTERDSYLAPAPGWLGITAREQPGDEAWWIAYGFEPWAIAAAPFCLPRPARNRRHAGGTRVRSSGLMALVAGRIGDARRAVWPAQSRRCAA